MPKVKITDQATLRHRRVRAGLIAKGTSFTAWCEANGIKHQNARKALLGQWVGPKATQIVERALDAAGVAE